MAGTILDHPFTHGGRGVGHDADDRVIFARHLLNPWDGKASCHAAQNEPAGPLVQRELQRGQQGFHHLRLDREEDQVAPPGDLVVDGGLAAQFLGQCLGLGGSAVGQINVLRVGRFADGARDGTAHIPPA